MAEAGASKASEAKTPSDAAPDDATRSTSTDDDVAKIKEMDAPATAPMGEPSAPSGGGSPKKRRKGRPCSRCIKRNIGHLCHDEPRESSKRVKTDQDTQTADEGSSTNNDLADPQKMNRRLSGTGINELLGGDTSIGLPPVVGQELSTTSNPGIGSNQQRYNDWPLGMPNQFQEMHPYHPSYMFNAPEVTNEYNILNDFLSTSLLDESTMYQGDDATSLFTDISLLNSMPAAGTFIPPQQLQQNSMAPPPQFSAASQSQAAQGNSIPRPSSTVNDKAKETYYMTAADPSGTDPPEERMNKLLKAKYDAGMLKPFNYVNGYARLNKYMEENLHPSSRQKILRQLDKFRPTFRERMHSLTDIELVLVEMWFERSLMEYDRVFASMAIPACCWRRTGQIFRGNKEMAQLINVPIESLRDGKLAIHEIIVEDQLVSYWEKFGAIAFDSSQKAMLTSCTLKSPDSKSPKQEIQCCFSFTIRRDPHNIPSIIVGNFLPTKRTDR
ncbi:Transcription factor [Ophidiomyces ophidiicola]|nr:Transcription factor [Ophidiomyces ophidiicola]KAI1936793.1 Transcription factor [Ophidiomyces ophidiicola]KAI1962760.1 Transcription factor [Ophidiomyces ophidiicola]